MFDKILFDRNAFDRSVSSDGISLTILSTSAMTLSLVVPTPFTVSLHGNGSFTPGTRLYEQLAGHLAGEGTLRDLQMTMREFMSINFSGSGDVVVVVSPRVTMSGSFSGASSFGIDNRLFLYQNTQTSMFGSGNFVPRINTASDFSASMSGSGNLNAALQVRVPLTIAFQGQGAITLRRIAALSENVIELININFLPGQTITIDTDLLQVLFGGVEDVSSVTQESVFFEISSGENELVIETDSNSLLDVTAIWQNRWL